MNKKEYRKYLDALMSFLRSEEETLIGTIYEFIVSCNKDGKRPVHNTEIYKYLSQYCPDIENANEFQIHALQRGITTALGAATNGIKKRYPLSKGTIPRTWILLDINEETYVEPTGPLATVVENLKRLSKEELSKVGTLVNALHDVM